MPVSDETKDFLEEAKKGKTRKFVMLVKGTSITSFIVYKKGNATKFIKQAKEDGQGLPYFGIITGKGMDLNFQLAVDDGFDKKPIKDLILKKFLEDEADFKCKPLLEIVQTRGLALDPDDPLHARFLKLQTAAIEACDKNPGEANKIGALCQKIGGLLDEDQRDPATTEIGNLEKLLDSLSAVGQKAGTSPDPQKAQFETLRNKLEPLLLAAIKAAPDKANAFNNVWNYADGQAEAGKFETANKALVGLADALKKTLAAPAKSDAEKFGIKEGLVAERRKELETYFARQISAARMASSVSLDRVAGAIIEQVPEEEEEEEEIGELLQEAVDELYDSAFADLSAALRAESPEKITALVQSWRKRVDGDALMKHLRTSKSALGVDASVDTDFARLFTAFEEKVKELAA
jgi:hypothetical protein